MSRDANRAASVDQVDAVACEAGAEPLSHSSGAFSTVGRDLALHVLSGRQMGAMALLRGERCLVGNLLGECDVVLDLPPQPPHACLLRVGRDGWTLLAVAGAVLAEGSPVAANGLVEIRAGQVLTLGDVDFCIDRPDRVDILCGNVDDADGPACKLPSVSRGRAARVGAAGSGPWRWGRAPWLAVVAAVLLAALAIGLQSTQMAIAGWSHAAVSAGGVATARALLAPRPEASALVVEGDPLDERRVLLSGYLPRREQGAVIDALLERARVRVEHRWVAIDELTQELLGRLDLRADELLHAQKPGHFSIEPTGTRISPASSASAASSASSSSSSSFYPQPGTFVAPPPPQRPFTEALVARDPAIRRALQEMPALLELRYRIGLDTDAAAAEVIYQRAASMPGGVRVTGWPVDTAPELPRVLQVRTGALPSLVLSDGARYFIGASLPGGDQLLRIDADRIVLRTRVGERHVLLQQPARTVTFSRSGDGQSARVAP